MPVWMSSMLLSSLFYLSILRRSAFRASLSPLFVSPGPRIKLDIAHQEFKNCLDHWLLRMNHIPAFTPAASSVNTISGPLESATGRIASTAIALFMMRVSASIHSIQSYSGRYFVMARILLHDGGRFAAEQDAKVKQSNRNKASPLVLKIWIKLSKYQAPMVASTECNAWFSTQSAHCLWYRLHSSRSSCAFQHMMPYSSLKIAQNCIKNLLESSQNIQTTNKLRTQLMIPMPSRMPSD